ncbi:MAG: DinB family protein [Chloroflexi bacterium AL-W]|nr:DinB family protein [Chloroflexi bacterium AL-N1]NOK70689.1 DinB family protein [Chloroflexi bacterium AL-N10]NOK78508.1 DinB family protein [Chloroflexi bacterium AL-N5]NOK85592.1 DinB family protein [Chloroflexi bacterium AL-W]NOK92506.1 DinB family protein [Chloroflexi bacterium AL-N15]
MIDFLRVFKQEITMSELVAGWSTTELRQLTNEMIDTIQNQIADCTDADVNFVPEDPKANDPGASNPEEANKPWTLSHVIAHTTAGGEETAALAAELARGVEFHGRSRSEVPWETITTIEQCRQRLEESRRMRLASLDMWPEQPHLDNTHEPFPAVGSLDAIGYFSVGLAHEQSHLKQIADIIQQAKAART